MSEVQEQQPKVAANVVTSENLAEFTAKKLGLAETAPTEAAPEPVVEEIQSESPVEEAKPAEDRKQNPKLERRFSDLTKQREAAKAEALAEREARERLEVRIRELEAKSQPKVEEPAEEPKPEQFADMYEYAKALTDYRVEQRLMEEKVKEAQARAEAQRQQVINTWAQRVNAAKAEIPDFDEMVSSADVSVSNEVRDAIFESELGPQILYHLAENPEIANKLQGMTVTGALRTIGKLEAQFEKTEPQTKTAVKSKAPAPINPIKASANGPVTELDSNRQFHGSYQAWKAARLAGRIR
jgi:hypothetical protein